MRPIADNLLELGCNVRWHITLNQPSSLVLDAVQRLLDSEEHADLGIKVHDAPFSPLADRERFMELRQHQLEQLPDTDWAVLWDDDQLLADPHEAKVLLQDNRHDLIYATKLFFWGDDAHFTTHLPVHRSVFFFRRLPGDAFPLTRTIHAPAKVHDSARYITDLRAPLLDYGYMTEIDRARCFRDYKQVGKLDSATLALVREPVLHDWKGPYPLRRTQAELIQHAET